MEEGKTFYEDECWLDMSVHASKIDSAIRDLLEKGGNQTIPVIVQTIDGPKDEDKQAVSSLGGKVKRDLRIVDAFSVDLPLSAVPLLALNRRIKKIYYDAEFRAV